MPPILFASLDTCGGFTRPGDERPLPARHPDFFVTLWGRHLCILPSAGKAGAVAGRKIKVANPVVDLEGDEMTRCALGSRAHKARAAPVTRAFPRGRVRSAAQRKPVCLP